MGTSSSYSGSPGSGWSSARSAARELGRSATGANARRAAAAAAGALAGWEDLPMVAPDAPVVPPQTAPEPRLVTPAPRTPDVGLLTLPPLASLGGPHAGGGRGRRARPVGGASGASRIRTGASRSPR